MLSVFAVPTCSYDVRTPTKEVSEQTLSRSSSRLNTLTYAQTRGNPWRVGDGKIPPLLDSTLKLPPAHLL